MSQEEVILYCVILCNNDAVYIHKKNFKNEQRSRDAAAPKKS